MAEKKLVLLAKANASGIRRLLYRENLTNGRDQVKSDKLFDRDPDSLAEYLWDTLQGRSYLSGTEIDDGWMESFYDSVAALVNNFQPGTRNQIRVDIEEHTDEDDEDVYGRLHAKIWGAGITETEVYQNLMRPAPPPPDAAFPEGWLDNVFGEYSIAVGDSITIPGFDINTLIGEDLTLNVQLFNDDTDEELVAWVNAATFSYVIPPELAGVNIRFHFWLNSNANGITNAYEDRTFFVPVPFYAPAFPEDWIAQFMFQKSLRANEAFEFNVFDPSTVIGSGNLVLRVKFMHGQTELTPWEFVEESNYTPPVELVNEGIDILFALTDGEATANGTFLLAVLPPIA